MRVRHQETIVQDPTRLPPKLSLFSGDTAAVLFIDHQIGLLTGVRDMNVAELKHNVVALAKAAQVLGVPVIVTATSAEGM